MAATFVSVVLATALGSIGVEEVWWTVPESTTVDRLEFRWGITAGEIEALNPGLSHDVPGGTRLRVFQSDPSRPARAIGAPNRGRLARGRPMVEGAGWTLRPIRRRAWGTRLTVTTLERVLHSYHQAHPDGPPVAVGELARRKGGEVDPHVAHRTGRDVDLGYILTTSSEPGRFVRATAANLDVDRTWYLVRSLLRTGKVQKIFMSARIQRLLLPRARVDTPAHELARYFAAENPDPAAITLIRHRRRHGDHMHVRFVCAPDNRRCRSKPFRP